MVFPLAALLAAVVPRPPLIVPIFLPGLVQRWVLLLLPPLPGAVAGCPLLLRRAQDAACPSHVAGGEHQMQRH